MSSLVQSSSSLIVSIYKSRQTLLDIMHSQNYNIIDYEGFSINEINIMYKNNQLDFILEKNDENEITKQKDKIYIKYYFNKLKPLNLEEIVDDIYFVEEILKKNDTLYIVTKDEINDTLMATLKQFWEKDNIFIIIQNIKRLQFNILEHILVPKHKILNEAELINIRRRYNITDLNNLPKISRFDPVSVALGIKPGQVCEIIRPSKSSINSNYYRLCI